MSEPSVVLQVGAQKSFETIAQAVDAAPARALIVVAPGVYRESLRVERPLTITGEPGAQLESLDTALTVLAPGVRVRGLAFSGGNYAIKIEAPDCVVARCSFTGAYGPAVEVACAGPATFRRCRFFEGRRGGVVVHANAVATLIGCRFEGNPAADLQLVHGARAVVERCSFDLGVLLQGGVLEATRSRFQSSVSAALQAGQAASARLTDCRVRALGTYGVDCGFGAHVTLTRCTVRGGDGGVFAADGGTVELEGCRVTGARLANLMAQDDSRATARACTFARTTQGGGVGSLRNSSVTLEGCRIVHNEGFGVLCQDGASVTLTDCVVAHNALAGLRLDLRAKAVVRGGHFSKNEYGVEVRGAAELDLATSLVSANRAVNVLVLEYESRAKLTDARIRRGNVGVSVEAGATVHGRGCRFAGIVEHSVATYGNGVLELDGCRFVRIGARGALAFDESRLTVAHCRFGTGAADAGAVQYNDRSTGSVTDCSIGAIPYGIALMGTTVSIARCRLRGASTGVLFAEAAKGTMEDCRIVGTLTAGVEIREGADPTLLRCRVTDSKNTGVWVHGARGTIEECVLQRHGYAVLELGAGADPLLRRCIVRGAGKHVVLAEEGAGGRFEDSRIVRLRKRSNSHGLVPRRFDE